MKIFAHLSIAALFFLSSLGFALPKVTVDTLSEVQNVDKVIQDLKDYETRMWAIGLNGETLQPDGFHRFFAARDLEFRFFVRKGPGVLLGDAGAYEANRKVLQDHRHRLIEAELKELADISRLINAADQSPSSVGFAGPTLNPDRVIRFFGERHLEISYYVQNPYYPIGDASAFEKNLQVLQQYAQKLKDLDGAMAR